MTIEIAPYFHPTQIVLVDDDIDFLGNLSLQLDADLAYLLFDSTKKALDYLEQRSGGPSVRNRFFCESASGGDEKMPGARELLEIDTEALYREMYSADRFSQVSVVLVDYAMPQMNGIDFCRHISDPHIKKILFTGVATEAVAVDAFNNGIIDQYIRKHEHAVYDRLNTTIRQFQRDYIHDLFVAASDVLPLSIPTSLRDSALATLIDKLRRTQGLVEYYFTKKPLGFFFAKIDGTIKRVVIQTVSECRTQAERMEAAGAPKPLTRRVSRGEIIVDPEIDLSGLKQADEWMARNAHAENMPGREQRYWAVFDVTANGQAARTKPSYGAFLEWLDTVGYALM